MSVPYTREIEFKATSGQSSCVVLPMHGRGFLTRIVLKQIDGPAEGYRYDILNRQDACNSELISSDNSTDNAELMDRDLHKVIPTQSVDSGSVTSELFEKNWPYENRDERDARLVPKTQLYLDIVPNGSSEKTFQIAYTTVGAQTP